MVSRLQRKCVTNGPNARRRGVRSLTEQSSQARPGAKDCRLQGRWKRLLHRITLAPRPKCSTCVPHVCESNRMTHRITSTRQSTNPSRTGIHETTICRTELDPYQPAKALVQTFDLRICVAFVRHRSLTHVAAGLSRGESVNKTACIKRHVEVEHRNLKFS